MVNYIIAIGGTGAKVLQSVIHLCDCGYFGGSRNENGNERTGVPMLKLLLIDADSQCGNTTDTESLIRRYNRCHERYNPDGKGAIFRTGIQTVFNLDGNFKDIYVISPVIGATNARPIQNFTIRSYLSEEDNSGDLDSTPYNFMKSVYSKLEYERNIQEGFYAHPSIGSLMFTRWLKNSPHMADMFQMIRQDAASEQVRVFVIASSFGGTGASGFPAVAGAIRSIFTELENDRLLISGVFMLPYFTFLTRNTTEGDGGLPPQIDPAAFIENAKGALLFYLRQHSAAAYDKVYVLGVPDNDITHSSKIIRGPYADKGAGQKNWPHILELYAALAAYDFFSDKTMRNVEKQGGIPQTQWVGSSVDKEDLRNITWGDLPDGVSLRVGMSKFLLLNYIYAPVILNEFLEVSGGGDNFRFMKKPINRVNWAPVKAVPFRTGGLFAHWNDSAFNDIEHLGAFTDLYDYFCIHAEWIYKLLFAYPTGGGANQEITHLFQDAMLKDRYELTDKLKYGNMELQNVIDNLIKDGYNRLNKGLEIPIDAARLYTEIHNLRADPTDDVGAAVREIIDRVYRLAADYVR